MVFCFVKALSLISFNDRSTIVQGEENIQEFIENQTVVEFANKKKYVSHVIQEKNRTTVIKNIIDTKII